MFEQSLQATGVESLRVCKRSRKGVQAFEQGGAIVQARKGKPASEKVRASKCKRASKQVQASERVSASVRACKQEGCGPSKRASYRKRPGNGKQGVRSRGACKLQASGANGRQLS